MTAPPLDRDAIATDLPLRQRKKLAAMRHIQRTAYALVGEASFDAVSVEDIADRSGVSPSSVYRYFATKEGIFLWDEYDEAVIEAFGDRVRDVTPGRAMLEAMAASIGDDADIDGHALDHMRFVASIPQLAAARAVQLDEFRRRLAAAIVESGWSDRDASTFAGAAVGAFAGALEAWERGGGAESLAHALGRAKGVIDDLDRYYVGRQVSEHTRRGTGN